MQLPLRTAAGGPGLAAQRQAPALPAARAPPAGPALPRCDRGVQLRVTAGEDAGIVALAPASISAAQAVRSDPAPIARPAGPPAGGDADGVASTSGRTWGRQVSNYRWPRSRKAAATFLPSWSAEPGGEWNLLSFFGNQGKFFVPIDDYDVFLKQYLEAFVAGYSLSLAERYHKRPFRYYAELDFDWDMEEGEVMRHTHGILAIMEEVVPRFYRLQPQNYITSARTCFKVHINFPAVITTELQAFLWVQ
jgi:hypothetical protein